MDSHSYRLRFAPSPTGFLHVGGARTALFNYLLAKANKGSFILRIEDTDQERSTKESEEKMIESLQWLGLEWDEGIGKDGGYGPYRQSDRMSIYAKYVEQLLSEEKAYRCFCTEQELEKKKQRSASMGIPYVYDGKCCSLKQDEIQKRLDNQIPYTVRFRVESQKVTVPDVVQGNVQFDSSLIGDFIIQKSNHYPSYNFAVVVDDHLMHISHVIRGVGHLSNTPRQILIYQAFGWNPPVWCHVSEIVNSQHKKLSKRSGAISIMAFQELGYPKEAFINFMALLGWSPENEKEFLQLSEIIQQFRFQRLSKSPAVFDVFADDITNDSNTDIEKYLKPTSKLNHLSNLHIRHKDNLQYLKEIHSYIQDDIIRSIPKEKLNILLLHIRNYLDYYQQVNGYLVDFAKPFSLKNTATLAKEWLAKENAKDIINSLLQELDTIDDWEILQNVEIETISAIKKAMKMASKNAKIQGKPFFMTIRSAITGKTEGLELFVIIFVLGKANVKNRLQQYIN